MRALQVTEFSTPPVFRDLPRPDPAAREVRVRVAACGLNYADLLLIKGQYQETPEPPFTLGLEIAGVVDALGEGVTGLSIGDRVMVYGGSGGLADYCIAPASACLPIPDVMSFADAAGFQIAYGTSHLALVNRAAVRSGETLLVLGAAGGVGLTAVEIGAALGARVIAVARGADKCATAAAAGASETIDATDPELLAKLKAAGGADVVYDPVGGALGETALRACNRGARVLVIGFASGDHPQVKLNHMLVKNIAIHGFYWGGYLSLDPAALRESLSDLLEMYEHGQIKPHIGLTAPLDAAPEALEKLRRRETTGKVVITMAEG
ncbi:MAG: NADPH:quinone oxidoreductase family protein [Pseudomonadota bacterium]